MLRGRDKRWSHLATIFQSLNAEQQQQLLEGVRLFMTEAASVVFSVLDGAANLSDKRRGNFRLTYDGEPIDRDLLDFWMAADERALGERGAIALPRE